MTSNVCCVDLFCGAGGLTHGLAKAGVKVISGIDLDPQCKYPYEANNSSKFMRGDVDKLSGSEILEMFGDSQFRLLAGCAPCQPFSTYSRSGRLNREDSKWDLIYKFGGLVQMAQPELVTMENVPQLLDHRVFKDFLRFLDGYNVWFQVIECFKYGVPQARKRLVLLASRLGEIKLSEPEFEQIKDAKTVHRAISHLPPLNAGESDPHDPLHAACSLSKLNLRRIKASKPGGTWRDWEPSLLSPCHRRDSGKTYPSVYGRMEWNAPSPTITTQCFGYGNGRFGHPEQDRAITLREAAILQTFPDSYQFIAPGERMYFNRLGKLIGNAVPVRIGEVIGRSILDHLQSLLVSK